MVPKDSVKKIKLGAPIKVVWADAFCRQGWWPSPSSKWDSSELRVETLGFYMGRDKKHIAISQGRQLNGDRDIDNSLFIPLGMVRKITRL